VPILPHHSRSCPRLAHSLGGEDLQSRLPYPYLDEDEDEVVVVEAGRSTKRYGVVMPGYCIICKG